MWYKFSWGPCFQLKSLRSLCRQPLMRNQDFEPILRALHVVLAVISVVMAANNVVDSGWCSSMRYMCDHSNNSNDGSSASSSGEDFVPYCQRYGPRNSFVSFFSRRSAQRSTVPIFLCPITLQITTKLCTRRPVFLPSSSLYLMKTRCGNFENSQPFRLCLSVSFLRDAFAISFAL